MSIFWVVFSQLKFQGIWMLWNSCFPKVFQIAWLGIYLPTVGMSTCGSWQLVTFRIWTNWRWPVSSVVYVPWKEPGHWHFNQWNGQGRKWRWIHPTIMFLGRDSNFLFWDHWIFFCHKRIIWSSLNFCNLTTNPIRGAHEKFFHFIPMAVCHFSSANVPTEKLEDGPT